MKNGKKALKISLISVGSFFGIVVLSIGVFLLFAAGTTLKVKKEMAVSIKGNITSEIKLNEDMKALSWNIGYGALDENQDFFMDGGKNIKGTSKAVVKTNVNAMADKISEIEPDLFLIQEIDISSKRSYNVNELSMFRKTYSEDEYENSFAHNYKAGYVPVPVPIFKSLGKVESGIATFSKYNVTEAKRLQLPNPFSWPVNMVNLKRCLLVNRLPINGSDKELVLINLHLEAYSEEEGKIKQLQQLMGLMQEEFNKGNYVIAGGDFNQTYSNVDISKYPKRNDWVCPVIDVTQYPDFTFRMDDLVPTCRSLNKPYYNTDKETHQYYMIDGFVVSNNITINSLETLNLDFKNTDHNPVLMSFKLN